MLDWLSTDPADLLIYHKHLDQIAQARASHTCGECGKPLSTETLDTVVCGSCSWKVSLRDGSWVARDRKPLIDTMVGLLEDLQTNFYRLKYRVTYQSDDVEPQWFEWQEKIYILRKKITILDSIKNDIVLIKRE